MSMTTSDQSTSTYADLDPGLRLADDVLPDLGRLSTIGFLFDRRIVDAMVGIRVAALEACHELVVPCGEGELADTVADIVQLLALADVDGDAVGIFAQRVSLCLQRVADAVSWKEQGHVLGFGYVDRFNPCTNVFALVIDNLKVAEFAVADETITTIEGQWDNVRTLSQRLLAKHDLPHDAFRRTA